MFKRNPEVPVIGPVKTPPDKYITLEASILVTHCPLPFKKVVDTPLSLIPPIDPVVALGTLVRKVELTDVGIKLPDTTELRANKELVEVGI
jgi:hypothetical protein